MHVEVPFYFPQCHKILMKEGQHSGDIEAYVRGEVLGQRRRLLDGKRPDLEERLMQILIERAHGMFIWVKLQLAVFFNSTRFRLSRDVEIKLDELGRDSRLPETNSLYQQIMESNTRPETLDRMYAIRALQWTLLAIEGLSPDAIAKAISIDDKGHFDEEIDGAFVLEICSNLIILDEFGCCRLAHLSVIGFLLRTDEPKSQGGLFTTAQAHAQIAERCLAFVRQHSLKAQCLDEILPVGTFPSYAAFYWTHHCTGASHYRSLAPLSSLFLSFLNTISPSPAFEAWSELMFKVSTMDDPFRDQDQSPDKRIHRTEMSYRFRHRIPSPLAPPTMGKGKK